MKSLSVGIGIAISLVICAAALFLNPPQNTIFDFREDEIHLLNQRRSFYSNRTVGKFFENKVAVFASHYLANLSYGLDPNFYFFSSHPRERAGFTETQRIPVWIFPLFLFGIFRQLSRSQFIPISYFFTTLLIISFFSPFDTYAYALHPFFIVTAFTWLFD